MNAAPNSLNLAESDGARERLMEAAAQLFALRGFEVTTVRDIVTAAGTNLNAINYYFGGKRGLYQAVMLRELERARSFTAELPHAAANDPIEQRLESLVLRLLTYFVSQHSRLPRLAALAVVNPYMAGFLVSLRLIARSGLPLGAVADSATLRQAAAGYKYLIYWHLMKSLDT